MKRILMVLMLVTASLAAAQTSGVTSSPKTHAPLSQQRVCADEARKAFNEFYPPDKTATTQEFTSHYDVASRVCYVMVHRASVTDGKASVSYAVFDAVEGRSYASYIWINVEKKKYWEVAPAECELYPRGGETIRCHDADEFASLVDKYFGVAK